MKRLREKKITLFCLAFLESRQTFSTLHNKTRNKRHVSITYISIIFCVLCFLLSYSVLFLPTHCRLRGLLFPLITLNDIQTICMIPLEKGSALRTDLSLTTNHTHKRYLCSRRDSNPQSQQASSCRPTPYAARPLGLAIIGARYLIITN